MGKNRGFIFFGAIGLLTVLGIVTLGSMVIFEMSNSNGAGGNGGYGSSLAGTMDDWPSAANDMAGTYKGDKPYYYGNMMVYLESISNTTTGSDGNVYSSGVAHRCYSINPMMERSDGIWYLDNHKKLHITLYFRENQSVYYDSVTAYSVDSNGKHIMLGDDSYTKVR